MYATIDDDENNRVLFAGMDGRIRAAQLDTGEVSLLLELPDRAVVEEMHLVGESTLVFRVAPGFADRKKRRDLDLKRRLQVWNLRAIEEMNVKKAATPARTVARDRE